MASEEPFLDSVSFFYKDTITFNKYGRAGFYSRLLHLREKNNALEADAAFKKLTTGVDENIYAFIRTNGSNKILVMVNLSNSPHEFKISDKNINGSAVNVFTAQKEKISNTQLMKLNAWGYKVYAY